MPRPYGPLEYSGPPPATGAWREGDHPGERHFLDVGDVALESGDVIPRVRVAYETWGELDAARTNAVYICHALTGDSHVTGPAGPGHRTAGWWDGLVGPGAPIDTREWFVVCSNILGGCQGTTGPSSIAPDGQPWGSRFPTITVADMVEVERRVMSALDIPAWALMLGPSLGGMRVLEWMVAHPGSVRSGLVLGTTAAVTADEIGTHATQIAAIEVDPNFQGGDYYDAAAGHGPHVGMGIARRIAHLTYRSEGELDLRFGRASQGDEDPSSGGRFAVESYLDHQADKLSRRFDANTYIALTRSMSLFDVGQGRGGSGEALATIQAPLTVVAIDSDRLFPPRLQEELVAATPSARPLQVVRSPYGHDGFLVEKDQVGHIVRDALAAVPVLDGSA
jgi:homoserine O-acetyltransferase/O-succinyltransferase